MAVIGNDAGLTIDRILLATDLTPASEMVARYAEMLARRYESKLTLVHVVDLSAVIKSEDAGAGFALEHARQTSTSEMTNLLERIVHNGVPAIGHSLESRNPAAAIVRFADEIDADLIVAGTHSRRGLSRIVLGSCAEGIIRHATCPVITLGTNTKPVRDGQHSFGNIVFATDFGSNAEAKVHIALAFAQDAASKIYLCHVLEHARKEIPDGLEIRLKVEEMMGKMIPRSAYDWCDPECVVEEGDAADHILELARSKEADLIILGARHSSSWLVHLNDGVVGRILREAECPVMTIGSK
jgi:nucleotide-binding universal stress UspA family protein